MNITKHAKERYAERIMGRDNKTDVAVFVAQHEQKIKGDIEKMIAYGKLVYEGKSLKQQNSKTQVWVKDLWVIIYDPEKDNVVTLYNIDLGIGEEYDKQFIEKALQQIEDAKAVYNEKAKSLKEELSQYNNTISDNEKQIANYKSIVKKLEAQNQSLRDLTSSMKANLEIADQEVKEKVMVLTGRKIF